MHIKTISPLLLQVWFEFLLVEPQTSLMNTILHIFESSFSGVITFDPYKTTVTTQMLLFSFAYEALE